MHILNNSVWVPLISNHYFCYTFKYRPSNARNMYWFMHKTLLYNFKMLQLMWSMEYNPNLFSMLESGTGTSSANTKDESVLGQCGKFERKILQAAKKDDQIPLSVFVVASVIEARNKQLLGEAKGLDDVVKVLSLSVSLSLYIYI